MDKYVWKKQQVPILSNCHMMSTEKAEAERGSWARWPHLELVCGSAQPLSSARVSSAAGCFPSDWTSGKTPLWWLWSWHFSFLGEVQGPYFDRGHIALAIYHTLHFQWKCKVWREKKKNVSSLLNGGSIDQKVAGPKGEICSQLHQKKKHFLKMPGYRHQIDFKAQKAN